MLNPSKTIYSRVKSSLTKQSCAFITQLTCMALNMQPKLFEILFLLYFMNGKDI